MKSNTSRTSRIDPQRLSRLALLGAITASAGCSHLHVIKDHTFSLARAFTATDSGAKQPADRFARLWSEDSGSMLIARSAPLKPLATHATQPPLLAFNPLMQGRQQATRVLVSLVEKTVYVTTRNGTTKTTLENLAPSVKPGSYEVQLISPNPVWHASADYYQKRKLPVPPAGSANRFLRGALGDAAVFLQDESAPEQFALHCAPEWAPEVGGIHLPREIMESLKSQLSVGDIITIQ